MGSTASILGLIQFFFAVVIGLYFLNMLKSQQGNKVAVERESKKELEKLEQMRKLSLTVPLSEKTRPNSFSDIIGQSEGIKALKAALCSPNPQHIIIYGPPGIGKTAAARLVLEEAKKSNECPFNKDSKFIELDANTARFDERGIADPLIGSVHDPIYQGAGPMGAAGIPQPKPGAVTKAHGGLLFIDEIGELHPIQMNKLLKVLEDRKVFLESAYYSSEDHNTPQHIHEIFQKGLPADFRLVGATTRSSSEIPPAIRSRCLEVFFRALNSDEIGLIAKNAANKIMFKIEDNALKVMEKYAKNGREAVNIIQIAAGIVLGEKRKEITVEDIEWVVNSCQYTPRPEKKIIENPQVGFVNGLAVYGPNIGTLIEIEATTIAVEEGRGTSIITGIIEEEELAGQGRKIKRKGSARGSVDNVLTVLRRYLGIESRDYDIHLNFPGGIPLDGPSAGIAIATSIYSSVKNLKVNNEVAMTGEVSIRGYVKPVGGIVTKIEAAMQSGAKKVLIPKDNWQEMFDKMKIKVIPVEHISQVIEYAIIYEENKNNTQEEKIDILTASSY